jgi:hypothetical protein
MVTILLASSTGCGFIFTNGPPAGHEQMVGFSCTESNTGPVLDAVWASINLAGALVAASQSEADYYDYGYTRGSVIAVGLTWAALSGSAAAVGFGKTSKCRSAKQAMFARLQQANAAQSTPVTPRLGIDTLPQGVTLSPARDTLRVGEQLQLVATAHTSSGAPLPFKRFRWSSSNDAIASVSSAGLVTAHAQGQVVIAANADNVVGTATIVVSGDH